MTANGEWDPSEPWQVQRSDRILRGIARRRGGRVVLLLMFVGMVAVLVIPLVMALMK